MALAGAAGWRKKVPTPTPARVAATATVGTPSIVRTALAQPARVAAIATVGAAQGPGGVQVLPARVQALAAVGVATVTGAPLAAQREVLSGSSISAVTLTTGVGTQVGDQLVCIRMTDAFTDSTTLLAPTGTAGEWDQQGTDIAATDSAPRVRVWTRTVATAGAQTVTCAATSKANHVVLYVLPSGRAVNSVQTSFGTGGATTRVAPSATAPTANTTLICCGAEYDAPDFTAFGTLTLDAEIASNASAAWAGHETVPAGTTGTRSVTKASGSNWWVTATIAAGLGAAPPPEAGLTLYPMQPMGIIYQPEGNTTAVPYATPGGLVIAGRGNYGASQFQDVSAAGGTVLIYIDAIVKAAFGDQDTYHQLLWNASVYGAAVPAWPGNFTANETGLLGDFRVGSVLHSKLEAVLEQVVADNPHMGGFFADDVGSRSWFPGFSWDTFGSTNQADYRAGAIAVIQTFRDVADRHGLIVILNGTWNSGTLAANGGGYPTLTQHGCSLADGGTVEHHAVMDAFWEAYIGGTQWAAESPITGSGDQVMLVFGSVDSERAQWATSGKVAYYTNQPEYDEAPAPWGSFHATGLPTGAGQTPVALKALDGETINTYGTNQSNFAGNGYYTRKGFTYAANWSGPKPGGGTYDGFDDPAWFPIGIWVPDFEGTGFYTRMLDLGINTIMPAWEDITLSDATANGLAVFVDGNRFPAGTISNTDDPTVVGAINGEEPFDQTTWDSLNTVNAAWVAGADGPGRILWNNFGSNLVNGTAGTANQTTMATSADIITFDEYWFTGTNFGDPGSPGRAQVTLRLRLYRYPDTLTASQAGRGSHYGSTVSGIRKVWSAAQTRPIGIFIENGAPYPETAYVNITPVQMKWGLWATVVHGARIINWFNHTFRPGDSFSFNNFNSNFYGGPGVEGLGIYAAAKYINGKITELAPVLNSPMDGQFLVGDRVTGTIVRPGFLTAVRSTNPLGPYGGIDATCRWRPDEQKHYILASTREDQAATNIPVTFEMSDQGQTGAVELFSGRTLTVTRGGAIPTGFCELADTIPLASDPLAYRIDGGTGAIGGTRLGIHTLFADQLGPAASFNDAQPISMGMEFSTPSAGMVATRLGYWRATTAMGDTTTQARLYRVSDQTALGTLVTFGAPSGLGWQWVDLPSPIALTANSAYKVVVYFSDGEYTATSAFWSGAGEGLAGIQHGLLSAPSHAAATGGGQCTYLYGTGLGYPANSGSGANYWLDVTAAGPA